MFGGFSDITTSEKANQAAAQFIREKIAQIVKDPETARKLSPHELYARRPLCDGGYYQQFNRDNVSIVDLKETPIESITPKGIRTSDGVVHELDVIVFATGFDALDGNFNRVNIHGRNDQSLKEHWSNGPISYLGVSMSNFPNFLMVVGPQGPFANYPPIVEVHVKFISELIQRAEQASRERGVQCLLEANPLAESQWLSTCEEIANMTLFKKTASWIFGNNVEGKKTGTRFYFGGLGTYSNYLQDVRDDGYRGFRPLEDF